jgi:hypothetical protein
MAGVAAARDEIQNCRGAAATSLVRLSQLVLLDSEVGFVPCFRNPCATGTLSAAADGAVEIAHKRQRRGSLLLLDQSTTLLGCG